MSNCLQCAKPTKLKIHKFCSRKCFFTHYTKKVTRACDQCGQEFQVSRSRATTTKYRGGRYCSKKCMGQHWHVLGTKRNPKGRYLHNGYVYVHAPKHPHRIKNGFIAEHRLVAEQLVGRHLMKTEAVHHINGIKHDNSPANLSIVNSGVHYGHVECPKCQFHFKIR